jgi:hypothetical protein
MDVAEERQMIHLIELRRVDVYPAGCMLVTHVHVDGIEVVREPFTFLRPLISP